MLGQTCRGLAEGKNTKFHLSHCVRVGVTTLGASKGAANVKHLSGSLLISITVHVVINR
jgi:hypothetical protein